MEGKQKIILVALVAILAIALLFCIMIIGKYSRDNRNLEEELDELKKVTGVTVGNHTEDIADTEELETFNDDNAAEQIFENRSDVVLRTLKLYGLTNNGIGALYTEEDDLYSACLFVYDTQKDIDELYKPSGEKTTIDGKEYDYYKTEMKYDDYKKAVKELVSEEIFDKYFTKYVKNVDGELYIVNMPKEETEKFEIIEIKETNEKEYFVKYKYQNGDVSEERETTVKFETNEDGLDVISQIELK